MTTHLRTECHPGSGMRPYTVRERGRQKDGIRLAKFDGPRYFLTDKS